MFRGDGALVVLIIVLGVYYGMDKVTSCRAKDQAKVAVMHCIDKVFEKTESIPELENLIRACELKPKKKAK